MSNCEACDKKIRYGREYCKKCELKIAEGRMCNRCNQTGMNAECDRCGDKEHCHNCMYTCSKLKGLYFCPSTECAEKYMFNNDVSCSSCEY